MSCREARQKLTLPKDSFWPRHDDHSATGYSVDANNFMLFSVQQRYSHHIWTTP